MANDYVDLPFTSSTDDLENDALAYLQSQWEGYTPADGDPEVIQIEALSPMALDAITAASQMPQAALIQFGVQSLGIPYQTGTSAYTLVELTMQDAAGYTCEQGGQINIDQYAFQLTEDAVTAPGETTVVVLVASVDLTALANGLTGTSVLANISLESWCVGIQVLYPTKNGVDPATPSSYADTVSRTRRLNNEALVTNLDFELAAQDVDSISRAQAVTNSARETTVVALDENYDNLNTQDQADLLAYYQTFRMANTTVTLGNATFNNLIVVWSVLTQSGIDPTGLTASINAALSQELSSSGWGLPAAGDAASTTWENVTSVSLARLTTVISQVSGVYSVQAVNIAQQVATLSAALSTATATTEIGLNGLSEGLPNGGTFYVGDPTTGTVQAWESSANAAAGSASAAVVSQYPSYDFPAGDPVFQQVSGDLAMAGATPLPNFVGGVGTVTQT